MVLSGIAGAGDVADGAKVPEDWGDGSKTKDRGDA